jgi:excisionase family DNA binding protein
LPLGRQGLSVRETAEYLGVHPRSVWRLVERGALRAVRWPYLRGVRFDLIDVERLFSDGYKDGA